MPKDKESWRGKGWNDPPPTSIPLDYVPLPPTGAIYKPRRTLRRSLKAAATGATVTAIVAFLPVAAAAMVVLGILWALFCALMNAIGWPELEE